MAATLGSNSYGKSAIRLFKVIREGGHHRVRDLTVDIALEGDFDEAHVQGDNSAVLPTDTMKNTVYAKAAEGVDEIEEFGCTLAEHFLRHSSAAKRVRVTVAEHAWIRLDVDRQPHPHAFEHGSAERRTAQVALSRGDAAAEIRAGVADLVILKSAQSAFEGYPRDRYTTLPETSDRVLATSLTAQWRYAPETTSFDPSWRAVRGAMLDAFAAHDSRSVQHTLYAMGEAALEACAEVVEISLTMPNKHHLPVDLVQFGMENRNEIFVPTPEPYGLIEATVRR